MSYEIPTTYDPNTNTWVDIPTALIPIIAGQLHDLENPYAWQTVDQVAGPQAALLVQERLHPSAFPPLYRSDDDDWWDHHTGCFQDNEGTIPSVRGANDGSELIRCWVSRQGRKLVAQTPTGASWVTNGVRFNGAQYFYMDMAPRALPETRIAVIRDSTPVDNGRIMTSTGGGGGMTVFQTGTSQYRFNNGSLLLETSNLEIPAVLISVFDGMNSVVRVNGHEVSGTTGIGTPSGFWVGANIAGGNLLVGTLQGVYLAPNKAYTLDERTASATWFTRYYRTVTV